MTELIDTLNIGFQFVGCERPKNPRIGDLVVESSDSSIVWDGHEWTQIQSYSSDDSKQYVPSVRICPSCGAPVSHDREFCPYCDVPYPMKLRGAANGRL